MRSKQASHIDLDVNSGPEAFDDLFIDPPNLVRLYGPVLTGHFIHYSSKSDSMKLIPFQLTSKRGISSGNSSQQAFIKHQLCVTGGWAGNAEMGGDPDPAHSPVGGCERMSSVSCRKYCIGFLGLP